MKLIFKMVQLICFAAKTTLNFLIKIRLIKTITFFESYFQTLNNVKSGKSSTIFKLKLIYLIIYTKAAHILWMYLNADKATQIENILHFNFFILEKLPKYFCLFTILLSFLVVKQLNDMFFTDNSFSNIVLEQILLENDHSFTIVPTFNFQFVKFLSKLFPKQRLFGNNICQNLQVLSLLLVNILYQMVFLMSKHFLK